MTTRQLAWTEEELRIIGATEELRIATFRRDDTLRDPVIIWMVRLGNDIYVRSVKGRDGGWFPGARSQHAGRIWAGRIEKDVSFIEETDPQINDQIDAAYQTKYRRYPSSVEHINSPAARAATIKLVPRTTG
jgi:hypothetical protein